MSKNTLKRSGMNIVQQNQVQIVVDQLLPALNAKEITQRPFILPNRLNKFKCTTFRL